MCADSAVARMCVIPMAQEARNLTAEPHTSRPAPCSLCRDVTGEWGADSVVARMCVIPMAQEARGLDAGPRLVQRLRSMGDPHSAALVAQIAQEEVAHVAVGEAHMPLGLVCMSVRGRPRV